MRRIVSRATSWMSTYVFVEISPDTTTSPVLTRVSHATRPYGSSASTASSTPSEIWSATLSGWPSVTDSDVNRYSLSAYWLMGSGGTAPRSCRMEGRDPARRRVLLRPRGRGGRELGRRTQRESLQGSDHRGLEARQCPGRGEERLGRLLEPGERGLRAR